MSKTRVLIVEDQLMPAQLFEMIINDSEEFELVSIIDDANLVMEFIDTHKIDLILMDIITKNGANGFIASQKVKSKYPDIKIIVVTSMPECSYIARAKALGIESFWYKDISPEPILNLMKRTIAGEHIYPENTPSLSFGNINSDELTERELEVLRAMTGGYTNTEISEMLFISVATVKSHILSMLQKTGYRNRTELAVKAREKGIVIIDE